jgi:pSer/pThr/pTyr-binding forkhead associated (FHA) protein
MLGKLAPRGGGPPIPLPKPKLLVGRQSFCDVQLRYPSVSSRHCELELIDGYWHVRDLGSTNGTRVNGTVCTAQWLLPNDVLWVSHYPFTVLYTPPPGRPPPQTAQAPDVTPPLGAEPLGTVIGPPGKPLWEVRAGGAPLGKLIPCGGGHPVPLLKKRLILGRHESCDVVLRFPPISSRHCELEWDDAGWSVRDLGSRNGTRVDGAPCTGTTRLPPGSVLWLAGLRYEVAYAAPPGAAKPGPKPLFGQSLLEKAGLARLPPAPPGRGPKPADDDEQRKRYTLDE